MYPNDEQWKEHEITSVETSGDRWTIQWGSTGILVPADSPVEPQVGMTVRLYGKGLGFAVRGMFLDGQRVYYRTEAEDEEHREIELYGADAADWLRRWDDGKTVWSVEMGGLGPGYEQCIQITAAEILRHMIDKQYDATAWEGSEQWGKDRDAIQEYGFANERISELGLSGAQWGAAVNLAAQLYRNGPRQIMNDERVKDRKIQVQRTFPHAA